MTSSELSDKFATGFDTTEACARTLDKNDDLARFRQQFIFPKTEVEAGCIYLAGNSLGLQPVSARRYIDEELDDWARLGVEGHFEARHPWLPYHENLTAMTARLVGAKLSEVVVMNTLTVNLHLMMVSFYRPTPSRNKILIEYGAFPSDKYAVDSQASCRGYNPAQTVVEQKPRPGESTLRTEDILETIERYGDSIALILFGQVNYLTGQAFDIPAITRAAHAKGCMVGFNLAHGAGNLLLRLHDWDVDFAVWCGYKYLNAGPGALAGCFVHERYGKRQDVPRFAGWWGHDKETRFKMGPHFVPIPGAEGWQLSNPPIFQMAALRASMELFEAATMPALREKSKKLTSYLEYLLNSIPDNYITSITPANPEARGCQLSCVVKGNPKELLAHLKKAGAICDFREPDIIRVAPAPLYNNFMDVFRFYKLLSDYAAGHR